MIRRIILDTNIWVSFFISENFKFLDALLFNDQITLLFNQISLNELIQVCSRPKLKKWIPQKELIDLVDLIIETGEEVRITNEVDICRDKKDNFLLSMAIDGKADYLITGDEDLLVLGKIAATKILKITDFKDLMENSR